MIQANKMTQLVKNRPFVVLDRHLGIGGRIDPVDEPAIQNRLSFRDIKNTIGPFNDTRTRKSQDALTCTLPLDGIGHRTVIIKKDRAIARVGATDNKRS